MPFKRNPPKDTQPSSVLVSPPNVSSTKNQQENTRSANDWLAPLKIKPSQPKALVEGRQIAISGTNLIHSQVMKRDRRQCVLCHNNGKYEESRLEIVKVALHKSRILEYAVMKWLKDTRSIIVDFQTSDYMNLMTLCNPCVYQYDCGNFVVIPCEKDIQQIIDSDLEDQKACKAAQASGKSLPPRIWPNNKFEIYATTKTSDVLLFARDHSNPSSNPSAHGPIYNRFHLGVHPYLALLSAFETLRYTSSVNGWKDVDKRHERVRKLIIKAMEVMNGRLVEADRLDWSRNQAATNK